MKRKSVVCFRSICLIINGDCRFNCSLGTCNDSWPRIKMERSKGFSLGKMGEGLVNRVLVKRSLGSSCRFKFSVLKVL